MSSTAPRPSARRSRFESSIHDWVEHGRAPLRRALFHATLPRVVPFAAFIAVLAASPLVEGAFDARWVVVARALAAGALLLVFWRSYAELRHSPATPASEWMLAISLGVVVALLWVSLDSPWMHFGQPAGGFMPLEPDGTLDPMLVALRLVGFVLAVPLMEELFWRSFLMRWIDRRDFLALEPALTSGVALVVSSALFALEHSAWLAGLAAGLAYGTIYRRTGNLRACVASHAVSNLLLGGWILALQDWSLW